MGLFGFGKRRGRSPDVVDLADMQKKGLLQERVPEANEEGVVDFSSTTQSAISQSSSSSSSDSEDLGFLSNLAGAGNTNPTEDLPTSPGSITSSLRAARQKNQLNAKINELKLKMDDSDYKVGQLNEKIKELEARLREKDI